jgi:hypothetical protein
VPPSVCRDSEFNPIVPDYYRFTTTEAEIDNVELLGFDKVINNYKLLLKGDLLYNLNVNGESTFKENTASLPVIINTKIQEQK